MDDDDEIQLQSYQDDLTIDDSATDPLMEEVGDDPTVELGIPAEEFKAELDKVDIDDDGEPVFGNDPDVRDDEREYIEDLDEDGDDEY